MRFLNLGCGYPRISGSEWVNLDNLHAHLKPGTPERTNLDAEPNYVNFDLLSGPLPFADGHFDGVLASHVFEHFDAQSAVKLMRDCRRVLANGGQLLASVPDAAYFRKVYPQDRNENWPELFGVTDYANPIPTFFEAALWFNEHMALFTEDVLWCYLTRAGFKPHRLYEFPPRQEMYERLNRRQFSLEMVGIK